MTDQPGKAPNRTNPRWFLVFAVLAVVGALIAPAAAQSSTASPPADQSLQEMEALGVRMSFEVASVKPNKSGGRENANVPLLVPGARFPSTGGLFSATNYSLITYVAWAYDIPAGEALRLYGQLPKWAATDPTDRFDIEARVPGNPSKAQMQLMMQSLLADRFKLALHTETKDEPIYALVLWNPGKTGPHLRPHVIDESCQGATVRDTASPAPAGPQEELPPACSSGVVAMQPTAPGRVRIGARNVTAELIANILPLFGKAGVTLDRPIIDHTGLHGSFDFAIEFTPQIEGPLPSEAASRPDAAGPSFLEALHDQLGLKLDAQTGPVETFVIDHIEEPSAN
ncbi:MAG TPA: TIGR03435 family protein [Candidatus Acidoferrales bacterium]